MVAYLKYLDKIPQCNRRGSGTGPKTDQTLHLSPFLILLSPHSTSPTSPEVLNLGKVHIQTMQTYTVWVKDRYGKQNSNTSTALGSSYISNAKGMVQTRLKKNLYQGGLSKANPKHTPLFSVLWLSAPSMLTES